MLLIVGILMFIVGFWLTGLANDFAVRYLPMVLGVPLLWVSAVFAASSIIPMSIGVIGLIKGQFWYYSLN